MGYLFFQIIVWLLRAVVVGFIIGWFVRQYLLRETVRRDTETLTKKVMEAQRERDIQTEKAETCARRFSKLEIEYEAFRKKHTEKADPISPSDSGSKPMEKPDNLRRIWGIGPKIASLLNKNGIFTFAQLAQTSIDQLNAILDSSDIEGLRHIANADTWPEQARLAAGDHWEELQLYQRGLAWKQGGKPATT